MTRKLITITAAAIIALAAVLGIALLTGALTIHTASSTPTPASTGTVATFNDGYSTAMQDACQQGSTYACTWLKQN